MTGGSQLHSSAVLADTRPLGRGGLRIGPIGLGGAPLGNLFHEVDDGTAAATVQAAWDAGIRFYDTAPHYGLGLSERRLGAALAGRPRDQVVLCTKVGRLLLPQPATGADPEGFAVPADARRVRDYTRDGVLRSIEASLARLRTDRIDVVLVHDPDEHEAQALAGALPALADLRDEGVITSFGVGMNQSAMLARFVERSDLDVVMVAGRYTLLDRTADADLLPLAAERGVSVLAAGVFNSGILARDEPAPGDAFDYGPAPDAVVVRARRLALRCRTAGFSLRRAALQFPLTHPAVTAVVVGARSPDEVRDNVAALGDPVQPAQWRGLDLTPDRPSAPSELR